MPEFVQFIYGLAFYVRIELHGTHSDDKLNVYIRVFVNVWPVYHILIHNPMTWRYKCTISKPLIFRSCQRIWQCITPTFPLMLIPEQVENSSQSMLPDDCQYWNEELRIRGSSRLVLHVGMQHYQTLVHPTQMTLTELQENRAASQDVIELLLIYTFNSL